VATVDERYQSLALRMRRTAVASRIADLPAVDRALLMIECNLHHPEDEAALRTAVDIVISRDNLDKLLPASVHTRALLLRALGERAKTIRPLRSRLGAARRGRKR